MNKYQKALDELLDFPKWLGFVAELFEENRLALQELIDKETPMKPTQKGEDKFYCGKCGLAVADGNRNLLLTRCGNDACGQVVDWNENNDDKKEEGFDKIGYILDDILEHLVNHMKENGIKEQQEVSYIKSGLEIKVIVEFKEREKDEDEKRN